MKILAIETSCDETAISLLEASGGFKEPKFSILGNALNSQVELHKEYGGVYPTLAKREHSRNLLPLFLKVLEEGFGNSKSKFLIARYSVRPRGRSGKQISSSKLEEIKKIFEREPKLSEQFARIVPKLNRPNIDYIAVTKGPGLEPALWVGINFAKALSILWDIPIIPVNHMEGHIFSVFYSGEKTASQKSSQSGGQTPAKGQRRIEFPAISLLISGGHTELVLIKDWFKYKIVGETKDDAVGEAFDKTARMLGLPYPGGPEISRLASLARDKTQGVNSKLQTKHKARIPEIKLPRPMINSGDCHFSFSGLKTAVLYKLKDLAAETSLDITEKIKKEFAREVEDSITEVLFGKTKRALETHKAKTLIVGGGVIANTEIRRAMVSLGKEKSLPVFMPEKELTTDNAIMIGMAGYFRALKNPRGARPNKIKAEGNLRL
ncbi:hypothetical protein COV42_01415 [Candidatus Campbellbacteria bacterium CG11_big_fil_rev_8_21_14_0_20_44_21]|uniref:tRNA N6-adenosine threonylcarbamoyltransferase n=1 Tax=Candidatus Campbellbacteria bacterium CG22_combo_CG10-13_8_21_14_all_43_18 TaxID=1974530 RepID=A0A2H0DX59_9BACT|nr:MAG: hypothetical protein COW82_00325 [Candidatus Campbellbacteria bacterium CG22_combo_CG10-13_8_21_14_all_43_18]PIR24318.1 MAG: hypothetical protein COV42_01415 [Candidatus Campbellbacteria bacterium CG11_big_fil_rev_8_21_14_0_20_44_21]